jgi:UDP-glucose 4-epimerase
MKVLITGGAGYIGSHTAVKLIENGDEPIIVDNLSNSRREILDNLSTLCGQEIPFYEVDCTDRKAFGNVLRETQPDGVIHFAAFKAVGESVEQPLKYYHNNVEGLAIVLEEMLDAGIAHFVFSSSCTVYGQPEVLPATEYSPVQPANSPYGRTKQIGESMIRDVVKANPAKFGAVLLRYFNPIGAHSSGLIGELPLGVPNNLVPFLTQAAAGIRKELVVFGDDYSTQDGTCIRDYIHVEDLALAHIRALEWVMQHPGQCEAFNVGTGKGNSVKEVIDTFERVTGTRVPHRYGDRRAGDVEQIWASAERAEKELNWTAKKSLEDALRDSWNWQKQLEKLAWAKKVV